MKFNRASKGQSDWHLEQQKIELLKRFNCLGNKSTVEQQLHHFIRFS